MGGFIVTKVSEPFVSLESMEETRAVTKVEEAMVCKAARSLGLRVKKVHRRISMEEFDERWSNLKLCMFCGEQETPDHHLQHENEVILMIDSDEEQASNDRELGESEVATESIKTEHGTVKHEANANMILANLEDESMPQFQVPVSASKILRNVELEEGKSVLKNLEYVVLNENLEQERDQKNVNEKIEVDGDVGRDQKMIIDTETSSAHKVLVKMPSKEKRIKHLKAWKFKFKSTSKRSRLIDDKFSFVDATVLLNKEPQETIWDGVKKEFKETMAACGKNGVDRFKLAEEKESRLQVLDLNQTFMYHQIGHGVDISLAFKMLDHDKEMAVVLQRSTSLAIRDCPDRSSRANRVWKPGGLLCVQDHSDGSTLMITQQFHGLQLQRISYMVMKFQEALMDNVLSVMVCLSVPNKKFKAELEIDGCETKKHVLLLLKLANRVWECGELLATHVYHKWLEICYKHKWRFRLLESFSRLVVSVWINLLVSKAYEFSGQLQDSSKGEAESFPLLNFSAGQHLLWMQDNSEPIFIVSKLERKKKLCYKTWMFKYKVDEEDQGILQSRTENSLSRREISTFIYQAEALLCESKEPAVSANQEPANFQYANAHGMITRGKDGSVKTNLRYSLLAVQRIWEKETHDVDITDAYYVLQEEFEQVENHTPCSAVKLERPQDHGALLLPSPGDERFQIKHKWRFKLLLSILELELYLDSLVLVTSYAHQFDIISMIILMSVELLVFFSTKSDGSFFSTNLEVKVSLKGEDVIQDKRKRRGHVWHVRKKEMVGHVGAADWPEKKK